jgi:type I restriction enzyme M protein
MPADNIQKMLNLGISRSLIEIKENRIRYLVQNKEYELDPEEKVRGAVYVQLVEKYQYSPTKIDFEVEVPRRTPADRADIVVFEDEDKLSNYIVVEAKRDRCPQEEFNQGREQGFGNANSLRAKYLIVDSYNRREVFDVANFPPNERKKNRIGDIPVNYGLVPEYRLSRGGENDLKVVSFNDLASAFKRCHDALWSGGKLDPATAFDEMSKLIFAKIQDERSTANRKFYKFQVGYNESEVTVAQRCISLYDEARSVDPYVFTEPINVSDDKVRDVVRILEEISLTKTDLDAKGQAFEKFLGVIFRGGLGQFFTRRQIIEFVVNLLKPNEKDIVLDPSCGSGGFLLYAMKRVIEQIKQDYVGNNDLITRKTFDFSKEKVYGIEINNKIARVAMMDMIVNDDGHSNIENNTGLNREFRNPNIGFGHFTLIMTNPPFGVKIKRDDRDNLGRNNFGQFQFGGKRKSQVSDILFLEQYRKFLVEDDRKNPRIGVVVQTGVLNNPSNEEMLKWLKMNFKIIGVVSLPDFAFRKAGSGMKTSLLFLKKYTRPYDELNSVPDYRVFFAIAKHIGYDSTLRPDENDLPPILAHYENETENKKNGIFWKNFSDLQYRLDATYYFNKFLIAQQFKLLKKRGHQVIHLADLLRDKKPIAGKSPKGGVKRSTGEVPSVTITNITKEGGIDFSIDINFVPETFYSDFKITRGGLDYLDLLVAKDGATTGKTAIVDETFEFLDTSVEPPQPRAIFSEHVFRLRVKEGISPMYLHAFLNSELGQLQLETVTSGGAQGGITKDFAKEIFIPLVDPDAQEGIAKLWKDGLREAGEFKIKYEQKVINTKKKIDEALEASKPMDKKQVEKIMGR